MEVGNGDLVTYIFKMRDDGKLTDLLKPKDNNIEMQLLKEGILAKSERAYHLLLEQ